MKNLKMFAITIMAFAVMVMGVHAATEAEYNNQTFTTLSAAISAANGANGGEVLLKDDVTLNTTETITRDVTLNLGGHKLTINGSGVLKVGSASLSATLTVKNGKIETAGSTAIFDVAAKGTLVINGVDIKATGTISGLITTLGNVIVDGASKITAQSSTLVGVSGADAVTINLDGTYDVDKIAGPGMATKATINAKGTFTTATSAFTVQNGLNVNVSGNITTTTGNAVVVPGTSKGTLNITAGSVTSKTANAVNVSGSTAAVSVKISGGKLVGETNAVVLANTNGDTEYSISGEAVLESARPKDYAALSVTGFPTHETEEAFAKGDTNIRGILTGGSYLTSIIEKKDNSEVAGLNYTAYYDYLVAEGYEVVTENGYEIVRKVGETPKDEQPGNTGDGEQTTAPENTNTNVPNVPKTNDNILVYAGLGLVSAISVGFTARRKENN